VNEHWKPLYVALFHTEYAAFGLDHTLYLAVTLVIHAANVFLLARLLARRSGDVRAGAVGALAFGVTTTSREVLWWAGLGGLALSFGFVLAGFLLFERARERGGLATLGVGACVFAAPLAFGSGVALGPAVALEAWWLAPREKRTRLAAIALGSVSAYLILYALVALPVTSAPIGRIAAREHWYDVVRFATDSVGLGLVARNALIPVPGGLEASLGLGLALIYAVAIAVVGWIGDSGARVRLLLAQGYLALVIAPLALARAGLPAIGAAFSRYQYFPALAWTTALALGLAPAFRKRPRCALAASLLGLGLVAAFHAQAARRDERTFTPRARARHAELVARLVSAVAAARGPVFDAPLTIGLAFPPTTSRTLVELFAPTAKVEWTQESTDTTLGAFRSDPELREIVPAVR
jgi:hypothetical protein